MITDDPIVTNFLILQIKKITFKEVRPVTGAVSNTVRNYVPAPTDCPR